VGGGRRSAFATLRRVSGLSQLLWARRRIALAVPACSLALLALAASSTAATDTNVMIVYRAYQPAQLTVAAGQTVVWRNSGLGPHTVTAANGLFNSGTMQTGATFTYTFSTPGTYSYECLIHPTMKGSVVVLAALPEGASPGAATLHVTLSQKRGPHGKLTLVHVKSSLAGARALLQVQSPSGSSWSTTRRAQLSSSGAATFPLAASVHRRVRVVLQRPAGEMPLVSKTVRPPA
jgi:plastocyanin